MNKVCFVVFLSFLAACERAPSIVREDVSELDEARQGGGDVTTLRTYSIQAERQIFPDELAGTAKVFCESGNTILSGGCVFLGASYFGSRPIFSTEDGENWTGWACTGIRDADVSAANMEVYAVCLVNEP